MILIDQSQGSRDLIRYAPLSDPSIACLTSLSFSSDTKSSADVCFVGKGPDGKVQIGIEFKHLGEFLSAIHSGRFQSTQVQSMTKEYDICYLLLCGEYRCGEEGWLEIPNEYSFLTKDEKKGSKIWHWYVKGIPYQGPYESKEEAISDYLTHSRKWKRYEFIGSKPIPFGYLESALLSLSRAGIQHKTFSRIEDCAQWIGAAYRSWQKEWTKHKFFHTFDKSSSLKSPAIMDPDLEQRFLFAKEFPAMGYERALAAAKHFPSVWDMMIANVDEWMQIPGIGKTVARSCVSAVNKGRKDRREEEKNSSRSDGIDLEAFK